MRLLMNIGVYPGYLERLNALNLCEYEKRKEFYLKDGYAITHILKPIIDGDADSFLTIGGDARLQKLWMNKFSKVKTSLQEILLSQIEEYKPEIFYNLDAPKYDASFLRRLPSCVKKKLHGGRHLQN